MAGPTPVHPDCSLLAPLVGRWRGRGQGRYPTIEDFAYLEELEFTAAPKPFVVMVQRTKDATTGEPLHAESGYLRPRPDGGVECVIAQPTGITEVVEGPILVTPTGVELTLTSRHVGLTSSAKPVEAVVRRLVVDGDSLTAELWMAAVGCPLDHHLSAVLQRV